MTIALRRRWPWLVLAAFVALASATVVARRPGDDAPCSDLARLTRQFNASMVARPVNVSGPTAPQRDALALLAVYAERHPACFTASDRANIVATERIVQPWIRLPDAADK